MYAMQIALKIDVDTYRGIEDGAARLAAFLHSKKIPASFFVSLGPDNSGWAATRAFRHRGFLKKMRRTSALSLYGWRTVSPERSFPRVRWGRPLKITFSNGAIGVLKSVRMAMTTFAGMIRPHPGMKNVPRASWKS